MAPTRTPFTSTHNTLTPTTPTSHRRALTDPYKKNKEAKAKDALSQAQKRHLKASTNSPIVPRAREYGIPRHLKIVKSIPQYAPFEPRLPPTEDVRRLSEAKVRAQNKGQLDEMQFGHEIAALLGPGLDRVPGRVVFGDDAVRKYCKYTGLNQHVQNDERDVVWYEHPATWERRQRAKGRPPPPPRTDLELPVVCMNNLNAFGIDAILTGKHGFAWMVTPECSELDMLGPFHLFNNPGPMDNWKIRNWHYCGRYYAHRTGRRMSPDGWKKLPQTTKDAAMGINVGSSRGICVELVILQFCGLPDWTVWGRLNEAAANCVRPAKPPGITPNRLALAIRMTGRSGL